MTDTSPAPPTDPQAERVHERLLEIVRSLAECWQNAPDIPCRQKWPDEPDDWCYVCVELALLQSRDDLAGQVTRLTEERDGWKQWVRFVLPEGTSPDPNISDADLRALVCRQWDTLTARAQRLETALREAHGQILELCAANADLAEKRADEQDFDTAARYMAKSRSLAVAAVTVKRLASEAGVECGLAAALGDA